VEAVYIAPPHPFHVEWAVKAAKAGKHILCEKPLGMNAGEVKRMLGAARKHRVFFLEAFMYRCLPQTAKLVQLIQRGFIGKVRLIQASFIFNAPFDPKHRLFSKKLGGGGILDIGCYPVSFSRRMAGAALGRPFQDPRQLKGFVHRGSTGVDEWATATLKFPGDILAQLTCGTRTEGESVARVYGTKGCLTIPSPWFGSWGAGRSKIIYQRSWRHKPRTIWVKADRNLYTYEADEVARCIRKGRKESPVMPMADSMGNAKTLDAWLRQG
jgi:predicted dehydrogenase